VAETASTNQLAEQYSSVLNPLATLTEALDRHCEALSIGAWKPSSDELTEVLQQLAQQVAAAREAVEALQQAHSDDRQRRGHEMRTALNAIDGWAHILRLETNATATVTRAADVLDRNVRVLTKLIESTPA
jgi:signal transduction histidine kinase